MNYLIVLNQYVALILLKFVQELPRLPNSLRLSNGALSVFCLLLISVCNASVSKAAASQQDLSFEQTGRRLIDTTDISGRDIAWGDVDGDGDLDIAIASTKISVYLNENGTLTTVSAWHSDDGGGHSVAWGDVDGDGDLDLAVGSHGLDPSKVYLNEGGRLQSIAAWSPTDGSGDSMVAWVDIDADGDLDLTIRGKLYLNNNGQLGATASWTALEEDKVTAIAWGDMDGDGDYDLAIGNSDGLAHIYENEAGTLSNPPIWSSNWEWGEATASSLAWGDIDNDGDLELVIGRTSRVIALSLHMNNAGLLEPTASWTGARDMVSEVALGDVDSDGDLDLAVGNEGEGVRIFVNESGQLSEGATFSSGASNFTAFTSAVKWVDIDNDGDLDLSTESQIYQNKQGILFEEPQTISLSSSTEQRGIKWGDVNSDGYPDLIVGGSANNLYLNVGGQLENSSSWSAAANLGVSLVWGDVDGDGDLDLADNQRVYLNGNGQLAESPIWTSGHMNSSSYSAWGDVDGDGDLDLATQYAASNVDGVYLNDSGMLQSSPFWTPDDSTGGSAAAWGDVDGDGDLDLAIGRDGSISLYLNRSGMLSSLPSWRPSEQDAVNDISWGDVDGDGDLDLAVSVLDEDWEGDSFTRLYLNDNGILEDDATWSSSDEFATGSVELADVTDNGRLDLIVGSRIYLNTLQPEPFGEYWEFPFVGLYAEWDDIDQDGDLDFAFESQSGITIYRRNYSNSANGQISIRQIGGLSTLPTSEGYSISDIQATRYIPLEYHLTGVTPSIKKLEAYYSINGVGKWLPAIPSETTQTENISMGQAQPAVHTFEWDLATSGFFGQSDNVVVRFVAHRNCINSCQRATITTQTNPFRVRGTQVRVLSGASQPVGDALVYRLPNLQTRDAELFKSLSNEAYSTNSEGFLQGRGTLANGDGLIALQPAVETTKYTLYHTSATPVSEGLAMDEVTQFGVQELVVSPDNPLILYNLEISLEWDARRDARYLEQLEFDILRTSELLFDWSNGQAALGNVTIYHAKERWDDADVRIHTTNRLRPHATIGGVVSGGLYHEVTVNGTTQTLLYTPGHVEMGALWNRYGEAGDTLSEDWARTLAHELGHYLFFLFDNYIGIQNNSITRIDGCPGVMSDPYSDVDSEFHPTTGWSQNCSDTLSQQMMGQSDWETILDFYPWLFAPSGPIDDAAESGPNTLPLAVTQIEYVEQSAAPTTIDVNTIFLTLPDGSPYVAGSSARAFLFHGDAMTDLGAPRRDRVRAWNASPGDTLCVYEITDDQQVAGCETVAAGDTEMTLAQVTAWQPDVIITPIDRSQIQVTVQNLAAGLSLNARLYPANMLASEAAPPAVTLTQQGDGSYSATISTDQLSQEAYLRIYDQANPNHVVIADYTIGGAPVLSLSSGDTLSLSTGDVLTLSSGGTIQLSDGDVLSLSSGDVVVFMSDGTALTLSSGDVLTLSSGGTLTLSSGDVLSLSSGSTLSLSSGDVTITRLDGTTLSLSSGDTLSLSSGDTLTLSSGDVLSLSSGDTLSLSSGDVIVTLLDGTVLSLSSGDVLSLSSGSVLSLSSGGALSLSSGDALSLSSGDVLITQVNGETLSLSSGDVLSLSSGGVLSLSSGGTLSLSSGDVVSLSSGDAFLTRLDGDVLSLSSGDVLSLSSGGTLSLSSGDVLSLSSGGVLSLSSGDVQLVGVGDVLSLSTGSAPVRSGDGQVTLYADHRDFAPGEFYTIQPATIVPDALSWTTYIGQAYRITASPNAPDLSQASISINYLGRSIDDDRENLLHVYFYDGTDWVELETDVDEYHNRAVADAQGPGIYALMYSIDIPLANTGWNLIAYPLAQSSPMPSALDSITGTYTTVYGYDAFEANPFQRWEQFDTTAPTWVNDLAELTPGRGYWINATANAILKLQDVSAASVDAHQLSVPAQPPATYYGQLVAHGDFNPLPGMRVEAWKGNTICGQAISQEIDGEVVYVVNVYAGGSDFAANCGQLGDSITFSVDGRRTIATTIWDNAQVAQLDLSLQEAPEEEQFENYLPLISQR